MNVAAIFNLYKSINPPLYSDHVAKMMRRVEQELQAQEELQATKVQSKPCADGQIDPMCQAAELATRAAARAEPYMPTRGADTAIAGHCRE